jgi:hypothetical protein
MTLSVSREGVLTVTTDKPHGYKEGETIVISVQGKDDRWLVTAVLAPDKFSAIRDRRTRRQRRAQAAQLRKHYGR